MKEWLAIAFKKDVVRRGLKVSLIVGTILVAVNQGDAIIGGNLSAAAIWKIPMTYLVPYCVSTYVAVSSIIEQRSQKPSS